MGIIRKLSVSVLGLALVAGLCLGLLGLGTSPASAKSSKMKLPVKVVVDYKDAETGKWMENYTVYYKYNKKGDLTRIDLTTPDEDNWIPTKIRYKYDKKGRKRGAVATDSYGVYVYGYDKKGRLIDVTRKLVQSDPGKYITKTSHYTYEYDKKGRYVKRRFSNEDDAQQRRTYTYGDIKGSKSLYQMTLNLDERLLLGNTERNQM